MAEADARRVCTCRDDPGGGKRRPCHLNGFDMFQGAKVDGNCDGLLGWGGVREGEERDESWFVHEEK